MIRHHCPKAVGPDEILVASLGIGVKPFTARIREVASGIFVRGRAPGNEDAGSSGVACGHGLRYPEWPDADGGISWAARRRC